MKILESIHETAEDASRGKKEQAMVNR